MPDLNADADLEALHRELHDLAAALMRQDPPLDHRTKAIAEAEILALQCQIKIKTLEENAKA